MDETKHIAVLFDLDGVILDTETQYSVFWNKTGANYLGITDLGACIKGQTLAYIYQNYFSEIEAQQAEITAALNRFEQEMHYDYIAGITEFIADLRAHQVQTAIVTSSNEEKMQAVFRAHPELRTWVDRILTAEMFARSKPAPDCFLLGMEILGSTPETTYVFEDSFNGLKAGRASGATVIGLATTHPRESLEDKAHYILTDFKGMTYDKLIKSYTFAAE